MDSIPHIIHYCWFGRNPLPPLAQKCIASWRKYLPDYEIKEWNEENFDVNAIPYTREAYAAKKYAFVSDYARFKILYEQGGIYFDTDVEVIRPLNDIISKGPFMGCEQDARLSSFLSVAPGLGIAAFPGQHLYAEFIELYSRLEFKKNSEGKYDTVVEYITQLLKDKGLKNISGVQCVDGIYIYPSEYFAPMDVITKDLRITSNTRSIHWYAGTWLPLHEKIKKQLLLAMGSKLRSILRYIKYRGKLPE